MSTLEPPLGPGDHIIGDLGAAVTLVEYGDYECPFCGRAHVSLNEVLRRLGGSVRFAFRHFPLADMHPHALGAAEAAEAAAAQGKFWPMHDRLFENQRALASEELLDHAATLELDTARFAAELARHTRLDKVREDFHSGVRSGVNGTPTFFINGVRHDGRWDPDTLTAALQAAMRARANPG